MRIRASFIIFFSFLSISLNSADASIDELLSTFRWKNRVIIVMTSSSNSTDFKEQLDILSTVRKELEERDLVLVTVPDGESFRGVKSDEFQRVYNPDKETFRFILLGKDGGVKLTANKTVGTQEIFALIDSMPMRRMEMLLD